MLENVGCQQDDAVISNKEDNDNLCDTQLTPSYLKTIPKAKGRCNGAKLNS